MSGANEGRLRLRPRRVREALTVGRSSGLLGLATVVVMTFVLAGSASAAVPQGYTLVQSASATLAPTQSATEVATCPVDAAGVQTVPLGGGVYNSSVDRTANTNSSYPDPNGIAWDGTGDLGVPGTETNVHTEAVCAEPPAGYTQVASASIANPAGAQTPAGVSCPAGTVNFSGGAKASSQDVNVNLNSSFPHIPLPSATSDGWRVHMNNASSSDESFTVYAICAQPYQGYNASAGPGVADNSPPPPQTGVHITCPAQSGGFTSAEVALGGGVSASSMLTSVNINTTYTGGGGGWDNWENNASPNSPDTDTPYVICVDSKSYVRPKGASPMRASLDIAYQPCTSGNTTHGAPLSHPSCAPPVQSSNFLTVGTPDSNGAGANAIGTVTYNVQVNAPPTPNDVLIGVSTTDVRCKLPANTACGALNATSGPDYTGQLEATAKVRITDTLNGANANGQGTVQDTSFPAPVPCAATADTSIGSTCSVSTSANAIIPGSVQVDGSRAIWQLDQVQVYDGGSSGKAGSTDATLFEDEGVFVP